jgi:hypothetical protein
MSMPACRMLRKNGPAPVHAGPFFIRSAYISALTRFAGGRLLDFATTAAAPGDRDAPAISLYRFAKAPTFCCKSIE